MKTPIKKRRGLVRSKGKYIKGHAVMVRTRSDSGVAADEAWLYENVGSVDVYARTSTGTLVSVRIPRSTLADWVKRSATTSITPSPHTTQAIRVIAAMAASTRTVVAARSAT
jgi:hypothetical protein